MRLVMNGRKILNPDPYHVPAGAMRALGSEGFFSGLGMIRILLAEDDESMRLYLSRALEKVGYSVTAVDRGTAALPFLETERFDLLLTDIVMPEMDGIELAQQAAVIAPDMRVMFITGFAAVALKASKAAPSAKVLSKPFHLKDLVAEVDRLFETEDRHGRL